jgi:hypothetical protein
VRHKAKISQINSRARSKSASRLADRNALAQGLKTVPMLKRENEVFASFALDGHIDLSASRRLA